MSERCRFLADGMQPIHMIATELLSPIATTFGPNTLISSSGPIGAIQSPRDLFECPANVTTLRTSHPKFIPDNRCLAAVSMIDDIQRRPPAVHIFDPSGRVIHRIDITNSDDMFILAASCRQFDQWAGTLESRDTVSRREVISLSNQVRGRKSWDRLSIEDHLDALMCDEKGARMDRLQLLARDTAWPVEHRVIVPFVSYLIDKQIPFTHAFVQPTLLQARSGIVERSGTLDFMLTLETKDSLGVLDLLAVSQVWVVRYDDPRDRIFALEIYDSDRNCMAVFVPERGDAGPIRHHWAGLLRSLPRRSD